MELTKTDIELAEHMNSLRKNDWPSYLAIMCMMSAMLKEQGDDHPIDEDVLSASKGDLKRAIKRLRQADSPALAQPIEMTVRFIRTELLHKGAAQHG